MSADDRMRDLFNEMLPPPEQSSGKRNEALARLRSAIAASGEQGQKRHIRPTLGWAAAAAAVAAVIVAVLVLPGSTPAIDANLEQIARAARTVVSEELPPGAYSYVRREAVVLNGSQVAGEGPYLVYLLPETVEIWTQGTAEQTVTTVGRPRFFDSAVEEAYYAAGLDRQDRVGETFTSSFADVPNIVDLDEWSTDADRLADQIETFLAFDTEPALGRQARTLQLMIKLLDPTLRPSPNSRAAIATVLGRSGFATELLQDGAVGVSLEYPDPGYGDVREEVELDATGNLRAHRITLLRPTPEAPAPAGTVIDDTLWSVPATVDELGVRPAQ